MDLLTLVLTLTDLKRPQKQGDHVAAASMVPGLPGPACQIFWGVGHPSSQSSIKPPHPFFTPRVRLLFLKTPHFLR